MFSAFVWWYRNIFWFNPKIFQTEHFDQPLPFRDRVLAGPCQLQFGHKCLDVTLRGAIGGHNVIWCIIEGIIAVLWKELMVKISKQNAGKIIPWNNYSWQTYHTVYPKKYAHGFVVLCFVVVMQSFIMNSDEVFIQIHQGCFAGTGAIVRLPQCQWSKPDGYGKISQCITTTKHSKAKTVCIFLGIYCKWTVS